MTKLVKPVRREVRIVAADVVVTLAPEGILFRLKGKRTTYTLPFGYAYLRAAKLAGDKLAADRKAARRRARS